MLYEEEEEAYKQLHEKKVASNVWGTLGLFRLVGDLVEIFIPRVMEVFVIAAGGVRGKETDMSQSGLAPSQGDGDAHPGKDAPRAPDDNDK